MYISPYNIVFALKDLQLRLAFRRTSFASARMAIHTKCKGKGENAMD
jgi:hypothetical protein